MNSVMRWASVMAASFQFGFHGFLLGIGISAQFQELADGDRQHQRGDEHAD
jgi:hypothetical protein